MEGYALEEMVRQVDTLADDLRTLTDPVTARVSASLSGSDWARADMAYVTGDGDSYHAAHAAALAMEAIGGVACRPVSALPFTEYLAPNLPSGGHALVIAVSASGGTERVIQAIEAARTYGAMTLAITGKAGSTITQAADQAVVVELPDLRPSPGIRTYQASLLALLLIAIRAGQARGQQTPSQAAALQREIAEIADAIDATTSTLKEPCRELSQELADGPFMVMTGSGPNYGTALFTAAKMIEAAGAFAMGQDLEEWQHVERLAYPDDLPLIVIAPPGRSHPHAARVATQARNLGRRVVTVADDGDTDIARHVHTALPVRGRVREEFSPLLYHLFAGYLAAFLAQQLGHLPFRASQSIQ